MADIEDLNNIPEGPSLRMSKGQKSYNGLKAISGRILEECNSDLRWPHCMKTYKLMQQDATIAPSLQFMEMEIAKASWEVKIPDGYESTLKPMAEFITSVMNDMETPWNEFITSATSFNRFGFAAMEKVYRRRLRSNGSRYNDGKIGLRKFPLIAQDSIAGWQWSEDGRDLIGLDQTISKPTGKNNYTSLYTDDTVFIPRNKFILFRANAQKDSPIGTSPLNGVYVAWRFKTELEKFESIAISKDLRGLPVFRIPARFMAESASDEEKATYEVFKSMLKALHNGEQSGVIVPSDKDSNGADIFSFVLESVMGTSQFDIHAIITRFRNELVTGILCPQLVLGQNGSGSFALSENLAQLTKTVVNTRLREITDQLNHDLIPQLARLNGWDTEVLPYFKYSLPDEYSVDDLGKYLQRVAAAGMLHNGAETANWVAEQIGAPIPFSDTEISIEDVREQMTKFTSNSGEGLEAGAGNGTSDSVAERDNSLSNLEN